MKDIHSQLTVFQHSRHKDYYPCITRRMSWHTEAGEDQNQLSATTLHRLTLSIANTTNQNNGKL